LVFASISVLLAFRHLPAEAVGRPNNEKYRCADENFSKVYAFPIVGSLRVHPYLEILLELVNKGNNQRPRFEKRRSSLRIWILFARV
jgi:hypothetical protein